jgi:hypothetical protein
MNMHELHNNLVAQVALAPLAAAIADTTAQVGTVVDMQGFHSVEFYVITGALADVDATFAVILEHSDASNMSGSAVVTAADGVIPEGAPTVANFIFSDDNAVKRIGYTPAKGAGRRYVRLTITPAANTGAAPLAVLALKMPLTVPVAA